jgi:hypothetical protein
VKDKRTLFQTKCFVSYFMNTDETTMKRPRLQKKCAEMVKKLVAMREKMIRDP